MFQKTSGGGKVHGKKEEGGLSKLFVENFCLTVPEHFVEEPFSLSIVPGIENIYASEG